MKKNKNMMGTWVLAITMAAQVNPLFAQPAGESDEKIPKLLPRIDVLGDAEDSQNISGSYVKITNEEIQKQKPLSIQEQLKTKAGVNINEWEGFGLFGRIGIRGLSPDMSKKVLVLEDGVPVHPGLFTDPATYYMPPVERLGGIELLKGSGTLRYGPSSIGGTINFLSKEIPDELTTSLTAVGGNQGYLMGLIEGGGTIGDFGVFAQALHKQADGNRENNKFNMQDFMLKAAWQISPEQSLGIKASYFNMDAQATYTGLTTPLFKANPRQNPKADDQFISQRPEVAATYVYQISPKLKWSTVAYWNQFRRDWWRQGISSDANGNYTLANNTGGRNRLFSQYGIDTRLNLDTELSGFRNQIEFGLRGHREKMENKRENANDPKARSGTLATHDDRFADGVAAYLQDRFFITDELSVTPGVRVEYYKQKRDSIVKSSAPDNTSGSSETTVVLPGVGTTYRLMPELQLFAGWHRGFTPARVADSITDTGVSSNLDEERAENYEAGIRGSGKWFNYESAVFYTDYKNQIIQASANSGVPLTNGGTSEYLGAEFQVGLALLERLLLIDLAYTWIPVARFTSDPLTGTSWKSGNRINYSPEHLLTASIGTEWQGLIASLQYQFVGEQYSDAANTDGESIDGRTGKIAQYGIFNASLSYQVLPQLEVFGSVKNLFDKTYIVTRNPEGIFPGLFRQFFFGVKGTL